jgi:predicted transcriptional regulator YdeE
MKVMVIVKATKDSEAGVMPGEELLREMTEYNEQLVKAGLMLAGEGLHPSSNGARIKFEGKKRTVVDGPFAETKELIAGFWLWKVNSLAEAIEWVKKCPNPHYEDSEIEIRQVFTAEDFGDALTPELREKEAAILAQSLGLDAPRFENGRELNIAGLVGRYTSESRVQIPSQWEKFSPQIGKVPGQIGPVSYGVCKQADQGCFEYISGVEVKEGASLPAGFAQLRLAPQRYAVFTHSGHVSTLPTTIDKIWQKWVPDAAVAMAQAPVFERYTEAFNPQTGLGGMEIWIPIQA